MSAIATLPISVSTSTWTDLGAGPSLISASGGEIACQIADAQPSGGGGFVIAAQDSKPFMTTSHVWAKALSSGAIALVAPITVSAAPITTLSPYLWTPVGPGQYDLACVAATGLTVPEGATMATISAAGASVSYTTDGATTPTSAVGMKIAAGANVTLTGTAILANFQAISATGTISAEFFR